MESGIVLFNGVIHTLDGKGTVAEAVAFKGGRVTFVGANSEIGILKGYKRVDLKGKVVLPAFVDTHMHPAMSGIDFLFNITLHNLYSVEDYIKAIEEFATEHPDLPAIKGSGFQRSVFDEVGPRKEWLDSVDSTRPIGIISADGHSIWVNSKALSLAGITRDTPSPPGGVINRDPRTGEPSGLLLEKSAMELVDGVFPSPTKEDYKSALLYLNEYFNSVGLTTCHDAMVPLDNPDYYRAYEELAEEGKLTVRYRGSWYLDPEEDCKAQIEEGISISREFKTPYWQVRSFKLFADYVIEEGTGYLSKEYSNRTDGWRGIKVWDDERLKSTLLLIDEAGFQIHVHQIGDEAATYFLDALEYLNGVNGRRDRRTSFAHVQLLKEKDKERMAKLGVIAHVAPYWAVVDDYYEELNVPYLGKERADNMYPIKSLIDKNITVTIHSDFSVTEPNLPKAIYNGITRRLTEDEYLKIREKLPGRVSLPPPAERATVSDMVCAATINGAYANYLEGEIGTIEVGKRADFVVLDRDIFKVGIEEIPYLEVVSTYFEGKKVYG